jgi:hypothetical protein
MHGGVDFRHGKSPVEVTLAVPDAVAEKVALALVPPEPAVRCRAASFDDAGSVHSYVLPCSCTTSRSPLCSV